MKLVVGALRDFKTVGALTTELVERGCLADQMTFLTDHTLSPDFNTCQKPSFYRLHQTEALSIWAIREPEYYNQGIRDNRALQGDVMARMAKFDSYQPNSKSLSSDQRILRHYPLVLLHLTNRSSDELDHIKCLMSFAQDRVQMIDMPNW